MANMVLGMVLLGRRYSMAKYCSVLMISLGIVLCTIMSSQDVKQDSKDKIAEEDQTSANFEFLMWLTGISMLTFALFLSARMGIYQEEIYAKHGKHPMEALYYSVRNTKLYLYNLYHYIVHILLALFAFARISVPEPEYLYPLCHGS